MLEDVTLVKYLLQAIEQDYIKSIKFQSIRHNKFNIKVYVGNEQFIGPTYNMIEANAYVKPELLITKVTRGDGFMELEASNGLSYKLTVVE